MTPQCGSHFYERIAPHHVIIKNVLSYPGMKKQSHTWSISTHNFFVKASYFLDCSDSLGTHMCCLNTNFLLRLAICWVCFYLAWVKSIPHMMVPSTATQTSLVCTVCKIRSCLLIIMKHWQNYNVHKGSGRTGTIQRGMKGHIFSIRCPQFSPISSQNDFTWKQRGVK